MAPKKTRICVLHPSYEDSGSCFEDLDPTCAPDSYDKDQKFDWRHEHIRKTTAVEQVRALAESGDVDVFLNLCDGASDEDRPGVEVVEALERFGCAYTGADMVFYEPSKVLQKKLAKLADVPCPPWALITTIDMQNDEVALQQCQQAVANLKFPLIVKHHNGGGSIGMGRDSKVGDLTALMHQVRKFVDSFAGALVEEFIPGREFTVLVVENVECPRSPKTLIPVECIFGAGETFKHFDLKWRDYESIHWKPLNEQLEPELSAKLRGYAAAAFVALHGTSYGRADFRVSQQGDVYFLEHNPNCGVLYPADAHGSADYILTLDTQMDHIGFIDHIVAAGLARQQSRAAKACVPTSPTSAPNDASLVV